MSAQFLNLSRTEMAWIDDRGWRWTGIRCHDDGGTIVIDGDGEIPRQVKTWLDGGGVPTIYVPPPVDLVAYATDKRWRVETGGISFNGILVPTDDRAKLLLLGAATNMAPGSSAPLIVAGVNYGTLTDVQFKAINAAVIAHVQATFSVLASVLAAITAGTITTTQQIDFAAWPSNG